MSNDFIAMVYKACPCCGKKDEKQAEIMIHERLKDISQIHNGVTGFGTFCKECVKITSIAVAVVIVDASKSDDMTNPYRTGNILGMSEDWCNRALLPKMAEDVIKSRMFYMDYKDALQCKMPIKYNP